MLIFGNRKVQQVRGSFFVPLPPEWIKSNEMKKSDPVRIELFEDGNLKICLVSQSDSGSKWTEHLDKDYIRRSVDHGK
jgi:phosphate uptake regulator